VYVDGDNLLEKSSLFKVHSRAAVKQVVPVLRTRQFSTVSTIPLTGKYPDLDVSIPHPC
jgi:hypothetical protein